MFFEGSEKKFEIIFNGETQNLREFDKSFWTRLVEKTKATILSSISNEFCDAYLLSESSLFVWEKKILMITCGGTTLIEGLKFLDRTFGKENFELLFYQRKNEFRSYEQSTSFLQDVEILKTFTPGKAMRFGKMHSHHNLMFHSDSTPVEKSGDSTTELLMYDICPNLSEKLTKSENNVEEIRNFLNINKVLDGFSIDDYKFEPCGYSLNALKDEYYYTIHITPELCHSYISFETNLDLANEGHIVLKHLIETINPGAFDLISFDGTKDLNPQGYVREINSRDMLSSGYEVSFEYYMRPNPVVEKPHYF